MIVPAHMEETLSNENQARPRAFLVAVYLVDRAYGGPEEGGWYYDCGELVRTVRLFKNEKLADAFCLRLNEKLHATLNRGRPSISSILSEGRYSAQVHATAAPAFFPVNRPYYE